MRHRVHWNLRESKRTIFSVNRIISILEKVFKRIEKLHDVNMSYSLRTENRILCKSSDRYPQVAVLVQGDVQGKEKFTFNSVYMYRKFFPNAQIILSTWKIDDLLRLNFEREGIKVVTSEPISHSGVGNVNLQIQTTRAGLSNLDDSIEFVLKTRTDMRIYDVLALDYLSSIFSQYGTAGNQTKILVPSFNSMKFRCYSASDQIQYSSKDRLIEFWDCDFMTKDRNIVDNNPGEYPGVSRPNWARNGIQFAEEYLITQDLMKKGISPDYSLIQSLNVIRDYFVIVNENNLDLVWAKNSKRELSNRSRFQISDLGLISMQDWEWIELYRDSDQYIAKSRHQLLSLINEKSF